MKKILTVTTLVATVGIFAAGKYLLANDGAVGYRTVTLVSGSVEEIVSSTGTLQPTTTVEVGTQVSGQIATLLVDFNDRVEKGQLLARIDSTLLAAEVRSIEASLRRAEAELDQAERALARSAELHSKQIVTESELEEAQYARDIAAASRDAAEVSVERALRNLSYTEIRAPIDGVIVERTVDVGQTVAASTSAPKLFQLAHDLSEMEILASVDESDIGRVHEGQEVRFTVQAYSDRTFTGTVRQVRLQSATVENVVSYGVVVAVENPEGDLLPGMTATVEVLVSREDDVLKVSNSALRFRPSDAEPGPGDAGRPPSGSTRPEQTNGTIWTLDPPSATPRPVRVTTGLTDGQYTVVSGSELEEGMQVIVAEVTGGDSAESSSNPFQGQPSGGPPRPSGSF